MALPALSPGKSWVRTAAGWPLGRHSRPALANSPTSSFFLVSTLITGSPLSWWGRAQPRIQVSRPLASAAGPPCPAQWLRAVLQLLHAQGHRGLADPGGPGDQPDPAMPQRLGLGRHQQPPLPLIQMREDHRELRRQDLRYFLFAAPTTAA